MEEEFHAQTGDKVLESYPFLAPGSAARKRATWIPTLTGHALPGGTVTRPAYESLVGKMLAMLAASAPYDGLFFDIHGAMSVEGLLDPEGDMIERVRAVVGKKTVISTSMDLHGNVSWRLAHQSDLITCYRMAPHEDELESKERAVTNLLDRLESGKGKPAWKAWIPVPILLPGEQTSTRIEPGKGLYAKVAPASKRPGVTDAAIWIGYAWADEPRNHAVVMVTGDDKAAVTGAAEELARSFWTVRSQFAFVAPTATLEESLARALASDKRPFVISDMGDNPTAGGAGDVTWTLTEILKRPEFQSENGPGLIYASLPGPDLVREAEKAGVGGHVDERAGASVDARYAPPVRLSGTVEAIRHGDLHAETEVVVKVGSVHVIVTKKRKPYHYEADFTRLGLDPRKTRDPRGEDRLPGPRAVRPARRLAHGPDSRRRRPGPRPAALQANHPADVPARQGHEGSRPKGAAGSLVGSVARRSPRGDGSPAGRPRPTNGRGSVIERRFDRHPIAGTSGRG